MNLNTKTNTVQVKNINKKSFKAIWKKYKLYYLLLLPGFLYLIIFKYIPMFGIIISFKDYEPYMGIKGIFESSWVGVKHFKRFFESYYFSNIMGNTIKISLLKFVFGFPAPIIFALLLNEIKNIYYKRIVQTISYLPHFISWVVVAGLMITILSPDSGLVNKIRELFGQQPIMYLGEPKYFRSVLVISDIWKDIGWGSIVYLAAIMGIDTELYEAASIDGANKWDCIWNITLPGISNVIVIMLIFRVGGLLDAGFEQIFLLYSPAVYNVGDIIDTFVYRAGLIDNNYSYATAVGLFKSIIAMVLLMGTNWIAKKMGQEGIW